jgi:phage anti-repressor protein/CheY-like chemotaxis protein
VVWCRTNALIAITTTPIDGAAVQTVNARDLHEGLKVGNDFSTWIKHRIGTYGFTQGVDFVCDAAPGFAGAGNRGARIDYHLTLGTAKELCMVERNEEGRRHRRYFIDCERIAKAAVAAPVVDLGNPATLRHVLHHSCGIHRSRSRCEATGANNFMPMVLLGSKCVVPGNGESSPRSGIVDVLIVEDDDLVRDLICDDFVDAGLDVVCAANAEDGLQAVADEAPHPAVVVTDVNLGPGMDGFALRAEALRRWPAALVVMMSGNERNFAHMSEGDRSKCFLKPFSTGALVRVVSAFRGLHPELLALMAIGRPGALPASP